jgi:UrcA family protein
MNIINKKSLLVAALCLTLTSPVFAVVKSSAYSQNRVEAVTVSFADLNLNQAEGLAVLHKRIKRAAKQVCHVNNTAMTLYIKARRLECFDEAMTRANEQLGLDTAVGMVSN